MIGSATGARDRMVFFLGAKAKETVKQFGPQKLSGAKKAEIVVVEKPGN